MTITIMMMRKRKRIRKKRNDEILKIKKRKEGRKIR